MTEPITLAEAKGHLRIPTADTNHDSYITTLISVAREYAESFQRRKFINQDVTIYLQGWTGSDPKVYFAGGFYLPYGQLNSVTSIKYTDTDGTQRTWSSSEYEADTANDPGLVRLAYGYSFPTATLKNTNPIEIIFNCGYGEDGSSVPYQTKHAMLIMIADLFENRESIVIGQPIDRIRIKRQSVVDGFLLKNKLFRFGA